MRLLSYGTFLTERPSSYDDWEFMPIGMHNAARRHDEILSRTATKEYYYKDSDGKIHIVKDAKPYEKMASVLRRTKKVVGYLSESVVDEPKVKGKKPEEAQPGSGE